MTNILIDALGAIAPSVITGIILAFWNKKQKARDEKAQEIEELRREKELMQLDLELAAAQLSYAVAMAYKRGAVNGEMEVAIESYEKAIDKFRKFERKQLALHLN